MTAKYTQHDIEILNQIADLYVEIGHNIRVWEQLYDIEVPGCDDDDDDDWDDEEFDEDEETDYEVFLKIVETNNDLFDQIEELCQSLDDKELDYVLEQDIIDEGFREFLCDEDNIDGYEQVVEDGFNKDLWNEWIENYKKTGEFFVYDFNLPDYQQ